MANPRIYGPAARRRIDRTVMRDEARIDGRELPGPPAGDGPLPRTYRRFTLTSTLGADEAGDVQAAVLWEDGTAGVVKSPDKNAWGLIGETGEAAAVCNDDDEVEWRVTGNPGRPVYLATVGSSVIAGDTVTVTADLEGSGVSTTATLTGPPVFSGGEVLLWNERGEWIAAALGRTYRRFTLTATLDAGSSAAVEWEDENTGTVYDRDTCCWGLIGETGEAVLALNQAEDGVEWQVAKNPGQAVYEATTTAYISDSATTASVTITIGTASRTLTVDVPSGAISTDKQYPNSATVFVAHSRGDWKIVSFVVCEEDAA